MTPQDIEDIVLTFIRKSQYDLKGTPYHEHNGIDSSRINYSNLLNTPTTSSSVNASGPGSGTTTVAASFTDTKIPITSADFANGITYDSTNKRFQIVTAGQYYITGFIFWSNPSVANVSYQTIVYLNGSSNFKSTIVPPVTSVSISIPATRILNLSVGDYLELYGSCGGASTNAVAGALSYLCLAQV